MTGQPERPLDILIRSYYRDQHWLALALRSIDTFVTGHRRVVVVVPAASLPRMNTHVLTAPGITLRTCRDYPDDYLGQQLTKLHADQHTDADLIVHLDSDQIFVAPCDLRARLLDDTKPRLALGPADQRPRRDGWRRCPEIYFGQSIDHDLTVPPPLILARRTYAALREFCRARHGTDLTRYATATRPDHFSEVALLRGFALLHERSRYSWMDVRDRLVPECRTFWSRAQTPRSIAHLLPPGLPA